MIDNLSRLFFAIISRTVVSAPRPPAPNMFTRLFTPLHKGRGKPRKRRGGRGSCMEDGARRPSSYYGLPCPFLNYEL